MRIHYPRARLAILMGLLLASKICAGECQSPLDAETLDFLALNAPRSAQPGQTLRIYFGKLECCYFVLSTQACVAWTVDPPGAAELTPPPIPDEPPGRFDIAEPGELRLNPALAHGDIVTLTASVESGRRILVAKIHVYTPEMNPLVGYWREKSEITCGGFIRGDADQSGGLLLTDAVATFGYLFLGGDEPQCPDALDSNADDRVDLSDGVYVLNHLFTGGPAPPTPFPVCGAAPGPTSLSCASFATCQEESVAPELSIEELHFDADGSFSVTWIPFEVYKDYWGTYAYDLATGSISLSVAGGNYVPTDVRASTGSFSFEEKRLVLRNLWLGTPPGAIEPLTRCGHVFE